jgi:hypothetical protein
MANVRAMAKEIGMDSMDLLIKEVDRIGKVGAAMHIRARKDRLREAFEQSPMVGSELTGLLSPHLCRSLFASYRNTFMHRVSAKGMTIADAHKQASDSCAAIVRESFVQHGAAMVVMV